MHAYLFNIYVLQSRLKLLHVQDRSEQFEESSVLLKSTRHHALGSKWAVRPVGR
jgi:hypothetical protein